MPSGYIGMLVFAAATLFMLGSWWALVSAAVNLSFGILRATCEDRTLQGELDDYVDYATALPLSSAARYLVTRGIFDMGGEMS